MRHYLFVLLLIVTQSLQAQISHDFRNTPLTEALRAIEQGQSEYTIVMLTDDLEHLQVSARIKNMAFPETVKRICKGQPVKVKTKGNQIFVQYRKEEDVKFGVNGFIRDSFTHEDLDSVTLTFMNEDSVPQQSYLSTDHRMGWWQFNDGVRYQPGKTIIRFEKVGYETTYTTMRMHYQRFRKTDSTFGEVLMKRLPRKHEHLMREVTVTATRIKMVMRGDTIVYHADAFQLQSGSMLDKLIAMLPGVRLEADGQIFVNGRKVESLLVNGEDFFKGDPKVALDNLPTYMVQDVKVYEKTPDRLAMLGVNPEDFDRVQRQLAIDVVLKRQYSIGWIANATAGYGTNNHYNARAFALRFTPQSRLALFGYTNDVYGDSYYDHNGNWQNPGNAGRMSVQEMAAFALVHDKYKRYKAENELIYKRTKRQENEHRSSVNYFDDGSTVYGRNLSATEARDWYIRDKAELSWTPRGQGQGLLFELKPHMQYRSYLNTGHQQSAEWNRELTEGYMGEALDSLFYGDAAGRYRANLISSLTRENTYEWNSLSGDARASGDIRINPDGLTFDLGGSFRHDTRLHSLDHSRNADGDARQDRYQSSPGNHYSYDLGIAYNYRLNLPRVTVNLEPAYRYKQSHDSGHRDYYELESSEAAAWDIGRLASTKDALTQYIDFSNSYHSALLNRTHIVGMALSGWHWNEQKRRNTSLNLHLPLRHTADRLDYQRAAIDTLAHRDNLLFEPSIELRIDNNWNGTRESHFHLNYQYATTLPALVQTIGWRDDSTPLIVRLGNPDLSNEHKHEATAFYSHALQTQQRYLNATLRYTLWQNALVQAMSYDAATGIRTYRPDGIDGNWNLNGNISYRLPLDKKKRINLSTNTTADYRNSVDLLALSTEPQSIRTSVRRTILRENLSLGYTQGLYRLTATSGFEWTHSESDRFQTLNALTYSYGLSGSTPLPWGFHLTSSLTVYHRTGYTDARFNTTQPIWNASLSRSILGGRINLQLEAFDLLDRMSAYSYTMNAQQQVETYRNVLRRYLMLNLTWRMNREPKKK